MISVFVPKANADSVKLLRERLNINDEAVPVPVQPTREAVAQRCFGNVRDAIAKHGGNIVYGWVVWQHGDVFVEAEHHAIWRNPTGQLLCITPQEPPEKTVLFLPDSSATYDFEAGLITNNVRIGLIQDPRLERMFELASEKTELMNSVRRRSTAKEFAEIPPDVNERLNELDSQKDMLTLQVISDKVALA